MSERKNGLTYADAGVDIDAGNALVEKIKPMVRSTRRPGADGEIEHASAVIHTLRFGNHYREAVKAKSYLSFTNKRGGPGTSIQIPMMQKDDEGLRSHYITLEMQIEDAPRADEIVVVLGAADGGRLHPRIGNRYIDLEELAAEKNQ